MKTQHLLLLTASLSSIAFAAPELAPLFQDSMVIQRDKPVPIWGKAKAGSKVQLKWQGESLSTKASGKGDWTITLKPSKANAKGATLEVTDSTGSISISDVLVGDVWLSSGQSNMAYPMRSFADGRRDMASFNQDQLRLMTIGSKMHTKAGAYPLKSYESFKKDGATTMQWLPCTPQNVGGFSAVSAYFARSLQQELNIPIGIICNAIGGVGMESWLPETLIKTDNFFAPLRGDKWLKAKPEQFSSWMRGRAQSNLKNAIDSNEKELIHPFKPGYLFETSLRPIIKFPITGVIWYQGESNAELNNSKRNAAMMNKMIDSWREEIQQEELPFLMVQLPRINDKSALRAYWPEFREVQQRVADKNENTGLICSIELGHSHNGDVHPSPKAPVGERLTKLALVEVYKTKQGDEAKEMLSPTILKHQRKGKKVMLKLSSPVKLAQGDEPNGFTYIANKKAKPQEVKAIIKGDIIILELPSAAKKGSELRYNFSVYMEPNIVNEAGLPLFPWRVKL